MAARCSTTAAATPRSDNHGRRSSITSLGTELLDDPAADPGDRGRVAPRTSRGPTAGSAAPRRFASGWPGPSTACPGTDAHPARSRHRRWATCRGAAVRWARAARHRAWCRSGWSAAGSPPRWPARPAFPARSPTPGAPPLRDKSVDLVLVSQVAHHLTAGVGGAAAPGLRPPGPPGVIVADLRRGAAAPARCSGWAGTAARLRSGHPGRRRDLDPARVTPGRARALLASRRRAAAGWTGVPASGWSPPGGRPACGAADAHRGHGPHAAAGRPGLPAAVDVERWPELLPHYRWVRMLERRPDGGVVEMAAWRPFGPVGYPTWWVSEMRVDRSRPGGVLPPCSGHHHRHGRGLAARARGERHRVTIVHEWSGPRWPLVGGITASWVIGPVFIHGIASRTLAGIKRAVERGESA